MTIRRTVARLAAAVLATLATLCLAFTAAAQPKPAPPLDCSARFAYLSEDREPRGWSSVTIRDQTLSFPCGSNMGTCSFRLAGTDLHASFTGMQGTNSTVFQRVAPP